MSELVADPGNTRLHVSSPLMRESLMDRALLEATHTAQERRLYPDLHVVKIGGLSIIDRGRAAILPLLDELVANRDRHQLLLGVGGGTRERHTYAIGLDLGLPTGALAAIAGAMPRQNAVLLQLLLAHAKGVRVDRGDLDKLPVFLAAGCLPVMVGSPPYDYWEPPTPAARLPQHGTDTGMLLLAEVLGARACILVKDVDGLYDADPKTHPDATLIPRIGAAELLARGLPDLPVERPVLEILTVARHATEVRLVNGLVRGNLTRALAGESVGTVIHR